MTYHSGAIVPDPADPVLRAMFAARKRVFVDLLGWDVPVLGDTYEIDQFDTRHATYLVIGGEDHSHRASARVLPTDRNHILADLFPALCDGRVPRGTDVREITRFCIDPLLSRKERLDVRNELVSALADFALEQGIARYTAVASRAWSDKIARFGWRCSALGPVCRIGDEDLVALQIDIDRETPRLLARSGIYRENSCLVVSIGKVPVS